MGDMEEGQADSVFGFEADHQRCWDPNGEEWVGDYEAHADPETRKAEASDNLARMLLDKYYGGKWQATDICKLCHCCKEWGMTGAVAEMARKPGLATGKYNAHMKKVLGLYDNEEKFMKLDLPCSDSSDGSRTTVPLPVLPPHELLNKEYADHPELHDLLATAVRDDKMPPSYTEHAVVKASSKTAKALALYVDGVPTTKKDGVIGFWVYDMLSSRRHLSVVVRKKTLCKCGCRGWCSLWVIFQFLAWSFLLMAEGENPTTDWLGAPLTDPLRVALFHTQLLFVGGLIGIKADWLECCSTFGFGNWKQKHEPCFSCWATFATFLKDADFGPASSPWPEFTHEDYLQACDDSEVHVLVLTMVVLKAIRRSLFFDRRMQGGHGRCLRWDVDGTVLKAGDRLEPTRTMPDTAAIETIIELGNGVWLTFWRPTQERVKHRNPLLDSRIGVTVASFIIDSLHALNLGTLQTFCQELAWIIMWSGVYCSRQNKT